ncbi:MAG: HPF/RaiA family ribosome-associated protein [Myxococcota bacterium]
MEIRVRTQDYPLTRALRDTIRDSVMSALGRHQPEIAYVAVLLRDLNGPRGGIDQRCDIRVVFAQGGPPLTVHDVATDAYVALHRASHKARTATRRHLGRTRRAA